MDNFADLRERDGIDKIVNLKNDDSALMMN
jgi:hypothetical protein